MFGFKIIKQEQYDDMMFLIQSHKSFLFVASTDNRKSAALDFANMLVENYDDKWGAK